MNVNYVIFKEAVSWVQLLWRGQAASCCEVRLMPSGAGEWFEHISSPCPFPPGSQHGVRPSLHGKPEFGPRKMQGEQFKL